MLVALGDFPLVQAQDNVQAMEKIESPVEKKEDVASSDDDILFVQEEEKVEAPAKVYDNFSIAVQTKHYNKIDNYLSQGSNINHKLYNGNTIVHISAFHRDLDFLIFAAERKANLSQLNDNDESILYWAAGGKSVQYLEEARLILGKEFNSLLAKETKIGRTPLHAALIYSANLEVINWLINNGVNIHAKDENGKTALHYAAGMRRWEALEIMLKNGGNINEVDNEGRTVEEQIFDRMDILSVEIFYPYVSPARKLFIEESVGRVFAYKLLIMNPKKYKKESIKEDNIKQAKKSLFMEKK